MRFGVGAEERQLRQQRAVPELGGELPGAAAGGVGLVDVVEVVVVDLVEALLEGQDRCEAVAPQHLRVQVGAPGLARHPCCMYEEVSTRTRPG